MKALLPFRTAFSHVSIHPFSVFLATRLEIRARFLYNMLGRAELSKEEKNYSVKGLPIYFCHKLSHGQSSEKGKQYRGSWNHSFSYANVTKCKSAVNTSNVGSFPQVWTDEGKKKQKQINVSKGKRQIFFSRVGGAWRECLSSLERMGISWRRKLQAHHKQREKSKRQETKD